MINQNTANAKKQLIGALIGLGRSTEGNKNCPNEKTDQVMLSGLFLLASGTYHKIVQQIELINTEKYKLVPRCLTCGKQCGRNNTVNIAERLYGEESDKLRFLLLSSIISMPSLIEPMECNQELRKEAVSFLYNALFWLGKDFDISEWNEIILTAGSLYKRLLMENLMIQQ